MKILRCDNKDLEVRYDGFVGSVHFDGKDAPEILTVNLHHDIDDFGVFICALSDGKIAIVIDLPSPEERNLILEFLKMHGFQITVKRNKINGKRGNFDISFIIRG